jgi:hypothetical protein
MITFSRSGHYLWVGRWGRRFRLPSHHVHSQTATALVSRCLGGGLSLCHLAFGWIDAEESIYARVGRRKRLPHAHPWAVVYGARSRDRQGGLRTSLAAGFARSRGSGQRDPLRRSWKAILSTTGLGDHAESCTPTVAAQNSASSDYALVEGLYRKTCESDSRPNRSLLAR